MATFNRLVLFLIVIHWIRATFGRTEQDSSALMTWLLAQGLRLESESIGSASLLRGIPWVRWPKKNVLGIVIPGGDNQVGFDSQCPVTNPEFLEHLNVRPRYVAFLGQDDSDSTMTPVSSSLKIKCILVHHSDDGQPKMVIEAGDLSLPTSQAVIKQELLRSLHHMMPEWGPPVGSRGFSPQASPKSRPTGRIFGSSLSGDGIGNSRTANIGEVKREPLDQEQHPEVQLMETRRNDPHIEKTNLTSSEDVRFIIMLSVYLGTILLAIVLVTAYCWYKGSLCGRAKGTPITPCSFKQTTGDIPAWALGSGPTKVPMDLSQVILDLEDSPTHSDKFVEDFSIHDDQTPLSPREPTSNKPATIRPQRTAGSQFMINSVQNREHQLVPNRKRPNG
eukprot:maker-scaffold153_size302544-snap-gene-2.27 protein:Tk03381 transcript:maker-scaffold153_size302544-snap-gene-2.27-mRNA-1 annotation:"hypothetical protein"